MADEKTPKSRDFQDVLTDIDSGRLHEQLTALWPEVVKASRDTNKPASLTLTLTVTPGSGPMVSVSPKVSTKRPAPAASAQLFYTDDFGNATKDDPRQQKLKVVEPTPIKRS